MSKNNFEVRTYRSDLMSSNSDEGSSRTVRGYAALFNSETELKPGIFERIAPGAFTSALSVSDIRALQNHNPDHVLGRTKSGTLRVWEDDKGLAFECDLPESRGDILESLKRGDVDQCSFAFTISEDGVEIERRGDGSRMITINRIDRVYDVTIATYPAYEDTVVSARSKKLLDDLESEQEIKPASQRNENILKLAEATQIFY